MFHGDAVWHINYNLVMINGVLFNVRLNCSDIVCTSMLSTLQLSLCGWLQWVSPHNALTLCSCYRSVSWCLSGACRNECQCCLVVSCRSERICCYFLPLHFVRRHYPVLFICTAYCVISEVFAPLIVNCVQPSYVMQIYWCWHYQTPHQDCGNGFCSF